MAAGRSHCTKLCKNDHSRNPKRNTKQAKTPNQNTNTTTKPSQKTTVLNGNASETGWNTTPTLISYVLGQEIVPLRSDPSIHIAKLHAPNWPSKVHSQRILFYVDISHVRKLFLAIGARPGASDLHLQLPKSFKLPMYVSFPFLKDTENFLHFQGHRVIVVSQRQKEVLHLLPSLTQLGSPRLTILGLLPSCRALMRSAK